MSIKNPTKVPMISRLAAISLALIAIATEPFIYPSQALDTGQKAVLIEADLSLEWDQNKGVYTAIGDAIVEQGNKSLKGDRIEVRYSPESVDREITQIIATGAVVYNDGDRVARGTKINYAIGAATYVLNGPTAIITGPHGTMKAEKQITYDANVTAEKQVVGIGNAVYEGKNGRIVEGERIVAFIDADGIVKNVNSDGNARVITPNGIIAIADRLTYTATTNRADLFGNVEIVKGENTIRGARAEVEFDKEISRLLSDNSGKRVSGVLNQQD